MHARVWELGREGVGSREFGDLGKGEVETLAMGG